MMTSMATRMLVSNDLELYIVEANMYSHQPDTCQITRPPPEQTVSIRQPCKDLYSPVHHHSPRTSNLGHLIPTTWKTGKKGRLVLRTTRHGDIFISTATYWSTCFSSLLPTGRALCTTERWTSDGWTIIRSISRESNRPMFCLWPRRTVPCGVQFICHGIRVFHKLARPARSSRARTRVRVRARARKLDERAQGELLYGIAERRRLTNSAFT